MTSLKRFTPALLVLCFTLVSIASAQEPRPTRQVLLEPFSAMAHPRRGVFIQAGSGEKGLEVTLGRILLSYASIAGGAAIPSDIAVFNIPDNGAGTAPSVALPATAEDGTVLVVGTSDANGAQITEATSGPHAISSSQSRRLTRIGGVWKSEF